MREFFFIAVNQNGHSLRHIIFASLPELIFCLYKLLCFNKTYQLFMLNGCNKTQVWSMN